MKQSIIILNNQELTAIHEAGHAVFAYILLRKKFDAAGVTIAEGGLTVCLWKKAIPKRLDIGYSLAGILAEQIATTDGKITTWPDCTMFIHGKSDIEKLDEKYGALNTIQGVGSIRNFTENFLRDHWEIIIHVARRLLANETLEHDEINKIVRLYTTMKWKTIRSRGLNRIFSVSGDPGLGENTIIQ